jgi:hypothetical protein
MPRVRGRWTKRALQHYAKELQRRGYLFPAWAEYRPLTDFIRDELVEMIEWAQAPPVFGYHAILVEKDAPRLRWKVLSEAGASLVNIDWRYVFDHADLWGLGHAADMLAALEACLVLEPLDPSDLRRLEQNQPGLTRKPAYQVLDAEAWEEEDDDDIDAEFEDDDPRPTPEAPPERRELFPTRKIKL